MAKRWARSSDRRHQASVIRAVSRGYVIQAPRLADVVMLGRGESRSEARKDEQNDEIPPPCADRGHALHPFGDIRYT